MKYFLEQLLKSDYKSNPGEIFCYVRVCSLDQNQQESSEKSSTERFFLWRFEEMKRQSTSKTANEGLVYYMLVNLILRIYSRLNFKIGSE